MSLEDSFHCTCPGYFIDLNMIIILNNVTVIGTKVVNVLWAQIIILLRNYGKIHFSLSEFVQIFQVVPINLSSSI